MLREIRLYGELGRRFGRVHHFAISNAAEAIRALRANFPEFERSVLTVAERYRVIVGRRRLSDAKELHDPSGEVEIIRIVPVVAGAKRGGILQTIVGIALIVVGVYTGNAYITSAGVSLTLGGVAQMLSPVPRQKADQGASEQKQSAVFSGPVNVSAQGVPVPVGYGRMVIGSAVISAGLSTREFAA